MKDSQLSVFYFLKLKNAIGSESWKLMKLFKTLLPFIATIFVYFLAINSPMHKQMDQNKSIDNKIIGNPIEDFKQNW